MGSLIILVRPTETQVTRLSGHVCLLPALPSQISKLGFGQRANSRMNHKMAEGYHKLASLIGDQAGLAMYRRFGSLAAKNLLYMQAELVLLEDELKTIAECDHQDPQCANLGMCWEALRNAPKEGARNLQWQKFLEIRAKINEYCLFPQRSIPICQMTYTTKMQL
jgi:hypothetical protein